LISLSTGDTPAIPIIFRVQAFNGDLFHAIETIFAPSRGIGLIDQYSSAAR